MITKILRPYWRLTRGMTLGAQAIVMDEQNRFLLIRHGYRPGWHFPGGGVEWNEPLETAMRRELEEETGVIAGQQVELFGMYNQSPQFPRDHIAVYIVKDWEQPQTPKSNMEIAEQRFFLLDEIPDDINKGTRKRLGELFEGQSVDLYW